MCMTPPEHARPRPKPVTVEPMRAFPLIKDLVTDVSWNFGVKKGDQAVQAASAPTRPTAPGGWRSADVDRVQEFRKCIECFLCQDVCHVLRDHDKHDEFIGPRFFVYAAALEMHPLDTDDRLRDLKDDAGHRLLQHHEVLHEGVPGAHHDHRQRDHPAQGARRRSVLRSGDAVAQADHRLNEARHPRATRGAAMFQLKPLSSSPFPPRSPRPSATGC